MSHAATNWAIQQRGLKSATKIVLWHLADCHNGHTGQCNPRQAVLADRCEMSRSTVNVHLGELERRGLIRRVVEIDPKTKRQRPTHYVLAMDEPQNPVSGNRTQAQDVDQAPQDIAKPCPDSGRGAESGNGADPCPDLSQSRVRNPDSKNLGIEPGKEPCAPARADEDFDFSGFMERFLSIYPRAGAKVSTKKALRLALTQGADPDQLVRAAAAYASDQRGNEERFIQYPENWLRAGRWAAEERKPALTQAERDKVTADLIRSGKPWLCTRISAARARGLVQAGLVTAEECARAGLEL